MSLKEEIENYIKLYFNYNNVDDYLINSSVDCYSTLLLALDIENNFNIELDAELDFNESLTILDFIKIVEVKVNT